MLLVSQELPACERQPEDVALLDEARRRRWQRCSQCRRMIDLGQGCRHMTCMCGHEFCYTCGKPWWTNKAAGTRTCEQHAAEGIAAEGIAALRFRYALSRLCMSAQRQPSTLTRLALTPSDWCAAICTAHAGTCDAFDPAPALAEEPAAEAEAEAGGALGMAAVAAALDAVARELNSDAVPAWVPPRVRSSFRTQLCMYYSSSGGCHCGNRCWFAHGHGELRQYSAGGSRPMPHNNSDSDSDSS